MFQLLFESNAAHAPHSAPRIGGSLVSTVGHVVLVAAVVALTAVPRASETPPLDPHLTYVAPPLPAAPIRPEAIATSQLAPAASVRGTPTLASVVDIPLGLPPVDFALPVTRAVDFAGGPRGTLDGTGALVASGLNEPVAYLAEEVDRPVVLRPGSRVPVYPEALRSAGIAGVVIVEFVVDTLGLVEAGSLQTLQADHDLFSASVGRIVPTLRFLPAEVQGRKVRQRVRLPFRFDLHS